MLEICSLVTGMVDAVSFNNWGTFVGMQTGNTVLLGLSTATLPASQPHAAVTTIVSIGSFIVGAYLTFLVARQFTPLRRLTLLQSFLAQTLLIVLAALLAVTGITPQDHGGVGDTLGDISIVVAIPPLAFQSGMQIATSRLLGLNELPTCVLTSSYADIAGDAKLFTGLDNPKRNRRIASAVLLLIGAIASGWIMRSGVGLHVVLWIAAGLKMMLVLGVWVMMEAVETGESGHGQFDQGQART
ncbi:hypothetical protein LTS18_003280 [Coniosporium uncinatum]|uniref:Uncharacterized protein n=1 Tax=Coniosporium uncinatum TaxID=93489 RepID=A0ACC3D793_9PEZI|nr:hypothetical protein LTS18_003280 [Coniosporium uncinatum]